jgi:hypothetical protein
VMSEGGGWIVPIGICVTGTMRYSRLHRCRLVSPALSISLFAALAAFPACAQGGVATHDEMERAKAALAEALKREQAGGGDPGPVQTETAPSSASPAAATVIPGSEGPKPPSEVTVAPEPPAEATVPIAIAAPPAPKHPTAARSLAAKSKAPVRVRSKVAEKKLAPRQMHAIRARKPHRIANAPRRMDEPLTTGSLPTRNSRSATNSLPPVRPADLTLPASLAPSGDLFDTNLVSTYRDRVGFVRGTRETLRALQQPLAGARGTPMKIVAACEAAITPVAVRQGASEIYTVGAGRSRWTRAGAEAPIEVRVLYKGLTGYEAHQARISCALDKGGQVQALSAR